MWLGTFILSQYIISSQISFALSVRGKGQDKHLTFAIFVPHLVDRAFCSIQHKLPDQKITLATNLKRCTVYKKKIHGKSKSFEFNH